jgi:hypothetical protein
MNCANGTEMPILQLLRLAVAVAAAVTATAPVAAAATESARRHCCDGPALQPLPRCLRKATTVIVSRYNAQLEMLDLCHEYLLLSVFLFTRENVYGRGL